MLLHVKLRLKRSPTNLIGHRKGYTLGEFREDGKETMLRFTKQVDYGLTAMQYIAAHQGDGVVGVRRIADEFFIPAEQLAKVLQRLARHPARKIQSAIDTMMLAALGGGADAPELLGGEVMAAK